MSVSIQQFAYSEENNFRECNKQSPSIPKLNIDEVLARIHWNTPDGEDHYKITIEEGSSIQDCAIVSPFEVIVKINKGSCKIVSTRDGRKISWQDGTSTCKKYGQNVTPLSTKESLQTSE